MVVVLQVAQFGNWAQESAWHQVNIFYYLPFVLLAPINGALGNELPKRWVLVGAAAYSLAWISAWTVGIAVPQSLAVWGIELSLVMVGAAIFSPARYALLPAAAHDSRLPLTRVNGLIEMGASVAGICGLILTLYLPVWPAGNGIWTFESVKAPAVLRALLIVNFICLLSALPVWFASDVRRPESASLAVVGFFQDCRRIWRVREARTSLLLLASFWGLLMAGSGAVFTHTLTETSVIRSFNLLQILLLVASGTAAGAIMAGFQGHPRRALGLVPLGGFGMLVAMAWAGGNFDSIRGPALVLGFMAGLVLVPLRSLFQSAVPADARGNAMAISNTANYLMVIVLALPLYGLAQEGLLSALGQIWLIAALAGAVSLVAGWVFFREVLELLIEFLIWPLYRIQGCGPGLDDFPKEGPLLVVVNHSSWLDPVWLAKILPRRMIPMMTSVFYDKPFLCWLMVHVVHAIRVQASEFRKEAPELKEAVAALDRGECVIVFPEGRMRRRDDQFLHRFGQGIWHILLERPIVPVIPCWIEGGWGSYFSYRNGPPMVNKRFDFWRLIQVGVSEPGIIQPQVLAEHRTTRAHLMQACLDARKHLRLETGSDPINEPL
jgi:1-acyl-sn-glycerol-3-phosphate acyltransferase